VRREGEERRQRRTEERRGEERRGERRGKWMVTSGRECHPEAVTGQQAQSLSLDYVLCQATFRIHERTSMCHGRCTSSYTDKHKGEGHHHLRFHGLEYIEMERDNGEGEVMMCETSAQRIWRQGARRSSVQGHALNSEGCGVTGASNQQHEWKVCGSVVVGGRECEHGAEDYQGID
jgi:hypothetical protein